MKKIVFFFLILSLFFSSAKCLEASQAIDNGITFLYSNQATDGHWTGTITDDFYATTEVLNTLLYIEKTGSEYARGSSWIASQSEEDIDFLAQRVFFLNSSSDLATLLSNRNQNGGWGSYPDFIVSSVIDTVRALQVLKTANYADQTVIQSAINYLLSTQNPDGGWGFYAGDDSNVYMTALVSSTLQQFPQTTTIATAINKITAYLLAHQNADGGFGNPISTVHETALTTIALINANIGQVSNLPLQTAIQNAINYLVAAQSLTGSWNNDPYSTALAIRALAMVKPNLSITSSDITFSNPTPTVGNTITITANIKNTGPAQAANVLVQFYSGDPASGGTLIGSTTIASIGAYGSAPASITWTIPTASTRAIFVKIDPLNTIDELSRAANTASKNLTSATLPDLSIVSADITVFPPAPDPYIMVSVAAQVRNLDETGASNVQVDLYLGDPAHGGMVFSSTIVPLIPGGGVVNIGGVIPPQYIDGGTKTIYVIVDPHNTVVEKDKTNNQATKTFLVGTGWIDLTVSGTGISFSPINPKEGDNVTISALVSNIGPYMVASNVVVRFYLGDPASGGTKIGSDVIVPSLGSATEYNMEHHRTPRQQQHLRRCRPRQCHRRTQ